MTDQSAKTRIPAVEGWRAFAVLGVFWWHAWIHTGNPGFYISFFGHPLNLQRLPVILGNGVDFFFVLSGFCIQLSLVRGLRTFTASGYRHFVFNRWKRLSPAFYAVCAVTAAALIFAGHRVSLNNLTAHVFWLYGFWPGAENLAPSFWSLQVEWEFYLVAPVALLIPRPKWRWTLVGVLVLASLVVSYLRHNTASGVIPQAEVSHLHLHFPAFACGMVVAEGWINGARWLTRLNGVSPLLIGALIAYAGRLMVSTEAFAMLAAWGPLAKTLGPPVMTLGFALMLASTLAPVRGVSAILESAPLQTIGRLSYSLYLWHWWPCEWLGHAFRDYFGATLFAHYLTLAATFAVCLPLAWLTYEFCERPYFRRGKSQLATAASA